MGKYVDEIQIPKMCLVKQKINQKEIKNIKEELKNELKHIKMDNLISENEKIGITVGSRGIANLVEILEELIYQVKKRGAIPYIIPAMGSHGGGTAKGQTEMLESLGVTEQSMGAEVCATGESVRIGYTKNKMPVYINKNVAENKFDKVILFNRIKEHTEFEGEIESGIHKICAIGLGNPKGALTVHQWALDIGYETAIVNAGEYIIKNLPIIFAVATVENYYHETSNLLVMDKDEITAKEKEYLSIAKSNLGKIPFEEVDILIVDELGKNISGSGIDTNVIGRIKVYGQKEPIRPDIKRIVVLGVTEESHGTATGIGLADFTTEDVINNIDFKSTYLNCITAQTPEKGMLPIYFDTEKESIAAALTCIGSIDSQNAKVVHIKNTNDVRGLEISEELINKLENDSGLEVLTELYPMKFDKQSKLERL